MQIVGHRRSYESLDSTGGTARVQRGGTVACACGWAKHVRSREDAKVAHDAHKVEVASGRYDEAVMVETLRRIESYEALLADDANFTSQRGLTREQVQGWLNDLLSGKTRVSI